MAPTDPALLASELRVVIGQLVRRLRVENRLPLTHGAVLSRIAREGPCSASELAGAERVRPQSMAQTLAELERDGLIARSPDSADRRRALVELTDAGRRGLEQDRRQREGWLAQTISQQLTDAQRRALADALGVLRQLADS